MISEINWYQDSPTAFDITINGIGGESGSAGCKLDAISPSGLWHIKSSDFSQPYPGNKISFTHASSSITSLPASNQFIFAAFADNLPNIPAVKTGEGAQPVSGWYANQTMVLVSQLDPLDPATW